MAGEVSVNDEIPFSTYENQDELEDVRFDIAPVYLSMRRLKRVNRWLWIAIALISILAASFFAAMLIFKDRTTSITPSQTAILRDDDCVCTADYNLYFSIRGDPTLVHAYCGEWNADKSPGLRFCYLHGGLSASKCPGAQRSDQGEFYWTTDETVCANARARFKWGPPSGDGQCGHKVESDCPKNGTYPCCSSDGWCGNAASHCTCNRCVDFSKDVKPKMSESPILIASGYHFPGVCKVVDTSTMKKCGSLAQYPLKVRWASGVVLNGTNPLICGGHIWGGTWRNSSRSSACYLHDRMTDTWKLHATMLANRSSHASVSINGVVWITGGYRSRNSTEFVYGNGSVIKGPDLPIDKWGHCMVDLEDGRAIILGGDQDENDVLIYRSSDNSFESGPPLLFGRRFPACTLFRSPLHEGRQVVLVVGGKSDGEVSAEVLDFTNTSSKWMQIGNLPEGHRYYEGAEAVSTGRHVYVLVDRTLYYLTCNTESCKWSKMQQELDKDNHNSVMMLLPNGYTC